MKFGNLLMNYSEILKNNSILKEKLKDSNPYLITILSNIITAQLNEIIEYSLRQEWINAYVKSGGYDNICQDSQKFSDSNLVIIFWELSNVINCSQHKVELMNQQEINALISKIKLEIDFVINNLNKTSLVLLNKFSTLVYNSSNLNYTNFDIICEELNTYIEQVEMRNIKIIDIDRVISKVSIEKSVDWRYYYSSKALYSIEFYKIYAEYIKPIILSIMGKSKKALIFDCDNTLWKGIVGEDGFEGIEMSDSTNSGAIFQEIQNIALYLNKRGIILGLCSKNNSQDIDNIIFNHPEMKIKDKNITIKKINWNNKASNLIEIANELNIGLDSVVFIDDSDFEVNLIREQLPQVTVLQVPDKLYQYPTMLRDNLNLFYNVSESSEDGNKIRMYKEQLQREQIKNDFNSIEDYLNSLKLKLIIYSNKDSMIPRVSQMTQKTNQFNLTTKRYTESDIEKYMNDNKYRIFIFSVSDRFGDYGITGLSIVKIDEESKNAYMDTFLMSCRVIGRNIEYSFLNYIISYLRKNNIDFVESEYCKTIKNDQVADFYENNCFKLVSNDGIKKKYKLNVLEYKPKSLPYIGVEDGR